MAFWNRRKKEKTSLGKDTQQNKEEQVTKETEEVSQPEKIEIEKEHLDEQEDFSQEKINPVGKGESLRYIVECCESIQESERQADIFKIEYEQVTEYLKDIQKIDRIAGDDREKLLQLCQKITYLIQERNRFESREMTINEHQIHCFDRYQDILIDEIKKMYQNEVYQKAIESDMKNLEKEKKLQREEQKSCVKKQNFLKYIVKTVSVLIGSIFVLLAVLAFVAKKNVILPYLGTVVLSVGTVAVLFSESMKNQYAVRMAERKLNRAIALLNRTKIKCVNNVSVLDYDRQKYGVKNAEDFENMWGEYCKAKDYERKFQNNTTQLNNCNTALLQLLEEYQVKDNEVWLVQTYAITDNREMVEIRHDLNQRRQKLREQIQFNADNAEHYRKEILEIRQAHPEWEKEVSMIFSKKGIDNNKKQ